MPFSNIGSLVIEGHGNLFPLGMVRQCIMNETESNVFYYIEIGDFQEEKSYLEWLELVISYGMIELGSIKGRVEEVDFSIYKNQKPIIAAKNFHISPLPLTIDKIRDVVNFIELEFVKEKDNATP